MGDIPLTTAETLAFKGIIALEQEITTKHIIPLRKDTSDLILAVSQRTGVPVEAFGNTYKLDLASSRFVPAPVVGQVPDQLEPAVTLDADITPDIS